MQQSLFQHVHMCVCVFIPSYVRTCVCGLKLVEIHYKMHTIVLFLILFGSFTPGQRQPFYYNFIHRFGMHVTHHIFHQPLLVYKINLINFNPFFTFLTGPLLSNACTDNYKYIDSKDTLWRSRILVDFRAHSWNFIHSLRQPG